MLALALDFWPNLYMPAFSADQEARKVETKLGLDLQGGLKVEYRVIPAGGQNPTQADVDVVKEIIERRVNATGVSEPVVLTSGSDRIVVEVPGISDTEAIRRLVGQTGRLDFVPLPVADYGTSNSPGPRTATAGQPLPTSAPALFSGDQVTAANVSSDQRAGASSHSASLTPARSSSASTRRSTSASSSRSSSTAASSRRHGVGR